MGDRGPDKDRVIDALVLAIANSELSGMTGSDALRSLLRVEYHDMVEGNVFDMNLLWELLEEQPGFDAEAAKPPLALFKSWESRLDLEVELPPALAELDDRTRALAASLCRVPPAELKLLFRPQTGESSGGDAGRTTTPLQAGRTTTPLPSPRSSGQAGAEKKPKPAWLGWLAIVFAIGGFSFAGYSGYTYCNPGVEWNSFDKSQLGDLPVKSAQRLGDQITAEINVPAWQRLDVETRHKKLKVALLSVDVRGVRVISLVGGGKTVASVQKTKSGKIAFWPAE